MDHHSSAEHSSPSSNAPTTVNLQEDTSKHEHRIHPDCPDTLDCLPDTDGRPQHTLPVILRCAILGSPKKRLTIREIYAAMEAKYIYYRTAGPTWKQSVRHHLSLNNLFERRPRPVTEPGFGSHWIVNLGAPRGTKRPRKRGRTTKTEGSATKRRGRPRKSSPSPPDTEMASDEDDDENKEDMKSTQDDSSGDDSYESEEDTATARHDRHYNAGSSSSYIPSTIQPYAVPPFATVDKNSESLIQRMQMEIGSLRRQSAEAVSVSLRLSEQLAQAQADATRTRALVRETEVLLEHERRRRREAERALDEELARRRNEDAFRNLHQSYPRHPS
ncbi:Forkhead box protein J2 [Leucoagaricus sp. SymC.cos]|nr:Forkhead box protein J2 [Leucoagaricus sp. SymC.cos]